MSQVRLLNEADLERLLAELRGVGVEQEMTKGGATDAFEEGYFAYIQFTKARLDVCAWSLVFYCAKPEDEVY